MVSESQAAPVQKATILQHYKVRERDPFQLFRNIKLISRSLAGKYVLKAKNKHGEDSAEVQVDVFGKPTIPTGPLQVIFNSLKSLSRSYAVHFRTSNLFRTNFVRFSLPDA